MIRYAKTLYYDHQREAPFQATLKQRIDGHFEARGGNRKATPLMWFKVALYVSIYWALWYSLAFHAHSLPVTALLLVGFALSIMVMAFNVSHDAAHGSLSGNRRIDNAVFWFTFNLLGPSAYLWKIRHNNAHHLFVNIPGSDMDLEGSRLVRIAPHTEWRPMHRYQHLYCSLLYAVFALHWVFIKDFKTFFRTEFGNMTGLRHGPWRFCELVAMKAVYVGYMLVLPAVVLPHPLWKILTAYVLFLLFVSYLLLLTFAASHVAMESHFVGYDEGGRLPHSFLEHQLMTSVDYYPTSQLVGFVYGGFNAHVAHHMFPNICSVHYAELSSIIKRTAEEHGLPYRELPLLKLFASHYALMKTMGSGPEAGKRFELSPATRLAEKEKAAGDQGLVEANLSIL